MSTMALLVELFLRPDSRCWSSSTMRTVDSYWWRVWKRAVEDVDWTTCEKKEEGGWMIMDRG